MVRGCGGRDATRRTGPLVRVGHGDFDPLARLLDGEAGEGGVVGDGEGEEVVVFALPGEVVQDVGEGRAGVEVGRGQGRGLYVFHHFVPPDQHRDAEARDGVEGKGEAGDGWILPLALAEQWATRLSGGKSSRAE